MPNQIASVNPPSRFVSPLFLVLAGLMVAYGWMLPNTNIPWIAFHRDAWIAVWMSLITVVAVLRIHEATPWHWITILTALFASVPLLQFATGLLPFAGIAWISTAYVWGFMLAMLTGALWARRDLLQPADAFFGCVGIAATLSAGMGMYQLFDLDFMGIWVLPPYFGEIRAYANLGQPNQLGTLLVWGVLSCGWTFLRGRIRLPVAVAWCMFLLAGITLTHSRTAALTLMVLVVLLWWWRRMWSVPQARWIIAGLTVWIIFLYLAVPFIPTPPTPRLAVDMVGKFAGESRPALWAMFLDATLQRPWAGYGWTQVSFAQMTVSAAHPAMIGKTFSHAHNLFIDFVLFMGWPLGLLASLTLAAWMWRQFRRTATAQDGVLLAAVIVVGIHAMLELPLHYAYFLLPTGLVVGILNVRNRMPVVVQTPRWVYAVLCAGGLVLLGAVVTDYLEVESNYQAMRFEAARMGQSLVQNRAGQFNGG